jgi:hypothetical protein
MPYQMILAGLMIIRKRRLTIVQKQGVHVNLKEDLFTRQCIMAVKPTQAGKRGGYRQRLKDCIAFHCFIMNRK